MKRLFVHDVGEEQAIKEALSVLSAGGLVVYPTETTYGIGADCENPAAIDKLLTYKGKRDGKPLSVAVDTMERAAKYVQLNDTARQVYATFLPGPVTVVSTGTGVTAPGVASATNGVGIRIPKYDIILKMLAAYGKGVTATGANASYKKRPYTMDDILESISEQQKELIDLILDVGELPHNEPSTVIDTTLDDIKVLRRGELTFTSTETVKSVSVDETIALGTKLISSLRSKLTYQPVIIALCGPMGMGKTHFTKGVATGLRIGDRIQSPTYTLMHEYPFTSEDRPSMLYHVDTWRIETAEQLSELELPSLFAKNPVIVIEWADRFRPEIEAFAKDAYLVWVTFEDGTSETERTITISYS